jgi:hypothetical protein
MASYISKTKDKNEVQFWTLNKDIAERLVAFERKFLERIYEG